MSLVLHASSFKAWYDFIFDFYTLIFLNKNDMIITEPFDDKIEWQKSEFFYENITPTKLLQNV